MPTTLIDLLPLLGLNAQGDVGPITIYQSQRGARVWFPKQMKGKPPSPARTVQRNRFRLAAYLWRALTPEKRATWLLAATRARLRVTGYNLWTYWILKKDLPVIRTIEKLTGLSLVD